MKKSKKSKKKQLPDDKMIRYVISRGLVGAYGGTPEMYMAFGTDRMISVIDELFKDYKISRDIIASIENYRMRIKKEKV